MKKYITERKKVVIQETKSLDYMECDLCGKKKAKSTDWSNEPFGTDKTMIKHKFGYNYPEGSHLQIYMAEICPTCFERKLIPWLQLNGCKAKYIDDQDY